MGRADAGRRPLPRQAFARPCSRSGGSSKPPSPTDDWPRTRRSTCRYLPSRTAEQRFLSPVEVATLADAIDPRYRAMVLVAAYGGLRFGELAGLRRHRVDLLRGRVEVAETLVDLQSKLTLGPPKTKRGRRTVPLPRMVLDALGGHLDAYTAPEQDALVFTNTEGGPLRRAVFRTSWWRPAVARAGLEPLTFHELRHTFVAMAIAAGADPKKVSVRAGHSSVAFTLDRYGHLYEDDEDQVTTALDALIATATPPPGAKVIDLRRTSSD